MTENHTDTLKRAPADYAPDLDIPGLELGLEWRPTDRPGCSSGLLAPVLGTITVYAAVILWVFWPW